MTEHINERLFDQIERYILDQMSMEERSSFEQRMAESEELVSEVELQRTLILGVEATGIKQMISEIEIEPDVRSISKTSVLVRYLIPFAALIAGVILVNQFLINPDGRQDDREQNLFAEFYTQDPGLPTMMGAGSSNTFNVGMVDYKQGEYEKARQIWEPIYRTYPQNDTIGYYIAMAYLGESNYSEADQYLKRLDQDTASIFRDKIDWYRALIALKNGDQNLAKTYLEQLGMDERQRFEKQVNQLKQRIAQ